MIAHGILESVNETFDPYVNPENKVKPFKYFLYVDGDDSIYSVAYSLFSNINIEFFPYASTITLELYKVVSEDQKVSYQIKGDLNDRGFTLKCGATCEYSQFIDLLKTQSYMGRDKLYRQHCGNATGVDYEHINPDNQFFITSFSNGGQLLDYIESIGITFYLFLHVVAILVTCFIFRKNR